MHHCGILTQGKMAVMEMPARESITRQVAANSELCHRIAT